MGKLAQGTDNDPYGKDLLTTRIIRDGSKRHQVCVAPILTVFLDKKVNFTAVIATFMKCPKIRKKI